MESAAFNSVRTEMTFTSLHAPSTRASCLTGVYFSGRGRQFHSVFISFGSIHMLQNSLFRGASRAQGQGKETAEKQLFLLTGLKLPS